MYTYTLRLSQKRSVTAGLFYHDQLCVSDHIDSIDFIDAVIVPLGLCALSTTCSCSYIIFCMLLVESSCSWEIFLTQHALRTDALALQKYM